MSFGDTYRIIALAPELIEPLFGQLLAQFGEDMPDRQTVVRTIGAHWDDTAHTRKRAASFPSTITGQLLTDGRFAFRALWQTDLMADFDANGIPGVEELTKEELQQLTPSPQDDP